MHTPTDQVSAARIPVVRDGARDECPSCGVRLGTSRGTTRRLPLLSPEPSAFFWQCPDCRGVWRTATGGTRPAQAAGSQTTIERIHRQARQ